LNTRSLEDSRYGCSQSYLYSLTRAIIGKRPKLMDPMLMDASSGLRARTATMRSSGVMVGAPPVVMQMTVSLCSWTCRQKR